MLKCFLFLRLHQAALRRAHCVFFGGLSGWNSDIATLVLRHKRLDNIKFVQKQVAAGSRSGAPCDQFTQHQVRSHASFMVFQLES